MYIKKYRTNDNYSDILMCSDGKFLTGLWFKGSKDSLKHNGEYIEKELPIFDDTSRWLDLYFNGIIPDFTPEYKVNNITPFRKQVIDIMNEILYGNVITYEVIQYVLLFHVIEWW